MTKYSREEKKEILKTLKKKLGTDQIEPLGYNRYAIREKHRVELKDGGSVWISSYKLLNEEGKLIPIEREYNGIFSFAKNVAVVCIRSNVEIHTDKTGPKSKDERQEGLIDVNGVELLPCIYDSVNTHLDGHIEITKNGETRTTRVANVTSGAFKWEV